MNRAGEGRKHWSEVAEEWVPWARWPNHDAFWAYRASLAAFIGCGNGKALDVGCGEGRISRELTACGFQVTAVDPSAGSSGLPSKPNPELRGGIGD
jgi:2-polyprenyl-3-methyl-5-hydroxy-6-metoxy-1,4-benzoquinol methylase